MILISKISNLLQRRIFFFFCLLIFNKYLLNPVVQDVLNLNEGKNSSSILRNLLAIGAISPPSIDLSLPMATVTPALGNIILSNSSIKVVFSKSMEPSSIIATLGTSLTASWTQTSFQKDTVTFSGSIPIGSNSFVLDGQDTLGISLTKITGTYTVLAANTNIYYVSKSGNNTNSGLSTSLPKLTIPAAVSAATAPAAIFIAAGNYDVDSGIPLTVNLVEKISLYGGFAQDFQTRNITSNISKIQDIATGVVTNTITINADASITTATVVDGPTIVCSSDLNAIGSSYAIYCVTGSPTISNNIIRAGSLNTQSTVAILADGASPTISSNTIHGGTSATNTTFGIWMQNGSSAIIRNNTINAGTATALAAHAIYTGPQANNPIISGNTVYGGAGSISYGLNTSNPLNVTLTKNIIDGGVGTNAYAIYHGAGGGNTGSYQSNSLFTSGGTNRYCLFEAGTGAGNSPTVFNNNQLYNCPTALYRDENTTNINSISTINGGTTNGSSYSGNF
jgi:hypothetical protein